jgi:hypothetical protein
MHYPQLCHDICLICSIFQFQSECWVVNEVPVQWGGGTVFKKITKLENMSYYIADIGKIIFKWTFGLQPVLKIKITILNINWLAG